MEEEHNTRYRIKKILKADTITSLKIAILVLSEEIDSLKSQLNSGDS